MRGAVRDGSRDFTAAARFGEAASQSRRRATSPLTLRLTAEERARLEGLAAGMTLSAYVRGSLFGDAVRRRRKRRARAVVADKAALAEALALLGQSRIANTLNQLAHQANIGALDVDEDVRAQIDGAYASISEMRDMLIKALRTLA